MEEAGRGRKEEGRNREVRRATFSKAKVAAGWRAGAGTRRRGRVEAAATETHTTVSMPVAPPDMSSLRLAASALSCASLIFLRMAARQQHVTLSMMAPVEFGQHTTTSSRTIVIT
jgi:hypothetical protein